MKLNYRMQSLFASAIQIGVLIALATLLILDPIYAREEGSLAQTEVTTGTSTPGDEIADVTDSTGEETPGPTSPPQKGYIIASTLNIRETPGSAGKIIGYYEYVYFQSKLSWSRLYPICWTLNAASSSVLALIRRLKSRVRNGNITRGMASVTLAP